MSRGSPARHFLRHFVEMVLAMALGMAVVGALFRGNTGSVPGTLAMVLGMAAPMAAWMRHRRLSSVAVAEMVGAMVVPAVALVALHSAGVIESSSLSHIQHALVIPSMLAVMLLRRREYTASDTSSRPGSRPSAFRRRADRARLL